MFKMMKCKLIVVLLLLASLALSDVDGGVIVRKSRATEAEGDLRGGAATERGQLRSLLIMDEEDGGAVTDNIALEDGTAAEGTEVEVAPDVVASLMAGDNVDTSTATDRVPPQQNNNSDDNNTTSDNNNSNNLDINTTPASPTSPPGNSVDAVEDLKNENIVEENATNSVINGNVDERNNTTEISATIKTNDNSSATEEAKPEEVATAAAEAEMEATTSAPLEPAMELGPREGEANVAAELVATTTAVVPDANVAAAMDGGGVINENDNSSNLNEKSRLLMDVVENGNNNSNRERGEATEAESEAEAAMATTLPPPPPAPAQQPIEVTTEAATVTMSSVFNEIKTNISINNNNNGGGGGNGGGTSEKRAKYLELTQEKRVPYDDLVPDFLNITDGISLNNNNNNMNLNNNNNNNNRTTSNAAAEIYALASMINVEQALKNADIDEQRNDDDESNNNSNSSNNNNNNSNNNNINNENNTSNININNNNNNNENDEQDQDADEIIKNNADVLISDMMKRIDVNNNDTSFNVDLSSLPSSSSSSSLSPVQEDLVNNSETKAVDENLSSENRIITNAPSVVEIMTTTPPPSRVPTTRKVETTTTRPKQTFQLNDIELDDEDEEETTLITTENPIRYYERNTLPTNEAIQKETERYVSRINNKSDTAPKISDIIQKIPTPTTTPSEVPDVATTRFRPETTSAVPLPNEMDATTTESPLSTAVPETFTEAPVRRRTTTESPLLAAASTTINSPVTASPADDSASERIMASTTLAPDASSVSVSQATGVPDTVTSPRPLMTTTDSNDPIINELSKVEIKTTESNLLATVKPTAATIDGMKNNRFVLKTTTMSFPLSTTETEDTDDDAFEGQQSTIVPTVVEIKSIPSTTPAAPDSASTIRYVPIEYAPEKQSNPPAPTTITTWTTTSSKSTRIVVTNSTEEERGGEEFKYNTVTDAETARNRSAEATDADDGNLEVSADDEDNELTTASSSLPVDSQQKPDDDGSDVNVIIAISVSIIGVIALILLIGFLFVMRKRQKQMTYGQRCRPVGLDAYSLDNVSVFNSVRRKAGNLRLSKRSYGNSAFEDPSLKSHVVSTTELATFAQNKNSIYEEFKDIPLVTARSDEVPAGCEDKNRYANVVPLPETRVYLKRLNDDELTEYINANYVKGPKDSSNYYIACQAPLESTIVDFWRMIWEQNSKVIIMATDLTENGVEKCAEYLPPSAVLDNNRQFGDYQVTLKNREMKEKYALSIVHLKNNQTNTWREIVHIWYQWPNDTSTPAEETSVIAMLLEARSYLKLSPPEQYDTEALNKIIDGDDEEVTNITAAADKEAATTTPVPDVVVSTDAPAETPASEGEKKEKTETDEKTEKSVSQSNNNSGIKSLQRVQGPLTVHCSPGTGRTGTIIACDIALRQLEIPPRQIDIPKIVYYVRRSRASSVRAKEQYEFIYKVANLYATKLTGPVVEN